MKKLVKILIFASVIAILTTFCAFADEEDGFVYSVYNGEAIITDYVGTETGIDVPDDVNGYTVTAIGPNALRNKNLTNISVPDTVLSIGEGAFADNPDLDFLELGEGLKSVPARMCENDSSLTGFDLRGIKSIGEEAFKNCSQLYCIFINGTEYDLAEITFGTDWDYGMPDGYLIAFTNPFIYSIALEGKCNITEFGDAYLRDIIIPEKIDSFTVIGIGNSVFRNTEITSVVFPDTITSIGSGAFADNPDIKSVSLPSSLTLISLQLFENDTGLEEVFIPSSITRIRSLAFNNCTSLENIYYGGTAAQWDAVTKDGGWNMDVPADCTVHFECAGLPGEVVSEPEADNAAATNLRRHAALRFTATSEDYNDFDKLGFLISRKDTLQSYGFAELTHESEVCGTPLYIEAICVDETHNRIYAEDNLGVRTYSVIASIPEDKTDTVFIARPFLEIGSSTLYGSAAEGSYDGLSV